MVRVVDVPGKVACLRFTIGNGVPVTRKAVSEGSSWLCLQRLALWETRCCYGVAARPFFIDHIGRETRRNPALRALLHGFLKATRPQSGHVRHGRSNPAWPDEPQSPLPQRQRVDEQFQCTKAQSFQDLGRVACAAKDRGQQPPARGKSQETCMQPLTRPEQRSSALLVALPVQAGARCRYGPIGCVLRPLSAKTATKSARCCKWPPAWRHRPARANGGLLGWQQIGQGAR